MSEPFFHLRRFLRELKRRNVYRVAVTYVAVAFVGLQTVNLLIPATTLPGWADQLFLGLVILGFPVSVVVAWAFEMTADGMRRTPEAEEEPAVGSLYQWAGLAVVVLLAGGVWYLTAGSEGDTTTESTATTDMAGRTTTAARDTAGPSRIAVLPFENIAPDSTDNYFARGMHEEVLNQLSKVSGLEVISRTSVMRYADTDKPVPTISQELGGVTALLEGTVRRSGDQIRITTQLIEAPEDEHLWSKAYERELSPEAIFDIQADIAQQIAGALETRLTGGERRRIEAAPTEDLAAYEAYMKGRNEVARFYATMSPAPIDQAIAHFREAVRRDSTFAKAHALLANAYRVRYTWLSSDQRWFDSVEVALDRARAADRDVPEVHWVQGFMHANRGSLEAAADAFQRTLELQPSNAIAASGLSTVRSYQGRLAEAVRWAQRAYRLEPGWPFRHGELGLRLRDVGRLKAAEAWFRAGLRVNPEYVSNVRNLAATQAITDPAQALNTMQAYLDRHPDRAAALLFAAMSALWADRPEQAKSYLGRVPETERGRDLGWSTFFSEEVDWGWLARMVLGHAELQVGNRERGEELIGQTLESVRATMSPAEVGRSWGLSVWTASGQAALGNTENALQTLERSLQTTPPVARSLLGVWGDPGHPLLDELRSQPRFQAIVDRIEKNREAARRKLRQMNLDLSPPEAGPDSAESRTQPR